jgi:SAM-dependent methyltransferase
MTTPPEFPALYHAHHALRSEDLPFWLVVAKKHGPRVLEIGCGGGRLLIPIAEQMGTAVGIDNDGAMLEFLSGQVGGSKPETALADATKFDLNRAFDVIIFACNTYSTFEPAARAAILQQVKAHLDPGGAFVFSMPNPDILQELPQEGEPDLEESFPHPETGAPVDVYSAWRKDSQTVEFRWDYMVAQANGRAVQISASARQRLDDLQLYFDELAQAGFQIQDLWGDYNQKPYQAESTYVIVRADLE